MRQFLLPKCVFFTPLPRTVRFHRFCHILHDPTKAILITFSSHDGDEKIAHMTTMSFVDCFGNWLEKCLKR